MQQLILILVLLFTVSLSGVLSLVSWIPMPLLQIGLGMGLAAFHVHSALDPSLFLLLFVAPLLYADAYRFPRVEFISLGKPILKMAVGLVLFTVVGAGYFIHWLIPAMPLAASFALASVLSPTDAVALAGSVRGLQIPSRILHLLEGEALLNDASGLVCFNFAVAAVLTGAFSPGHALLAFVRLSLGGVTTGAVIAFFVMMVERWIRRRLGPYPSSQILLSLLLPFAAYLSAEHLGFSGILSSVAAGFIGKMVLQEMPEADTRLKSEAITDMIQFTFNGLIFILLGMQLPSIAKSIPNVLAEHHFRSPWLLGLFVVGITAVLGFLRFLWSWSSLKWTLFRREHRGDAPRHTPKRLLAGIALAGVRGAVTLAAVLSLPMTLNDGTPFPGRQLAILLCAGVILLSLISASTFLPLTMRGVEDTSKSSSEAQTRNAQKASARAAIRRLEEIEAEANPKVGGPDSLVASCIRLKDYYQRQLEGLDGVAESGSDVNEQQRQERWLRAEAVRAQRTELKNLVHRRTLDHKLALPLLHKLDNLEAALQGS